MLLEVYNVAWDFKRMDIYRVLHTFEPGQCFISLWWSSCTVRIMKALIATELDIYYNTYRWSHVFPYRSIDIHDFPKSPLRFRPLLRQTKGLTLYR